MNEEKLTYRIPNNQIHISKEKDEDCLIWISSKAINMANTIEELQQENKKLNGAIQTYDILLKANVEENKQLKDNWNMLKEHLTNRYNNGTESISYRQVFVEIREMMKEIEKEND